MIQRRLRVVKWLGTTPALGLCTLCGREFKVSMNALKKIADAQASLQEQFDGHKCDSLESGQAGVQETADAVLRQERDDEEEEDDEDEKKDKDDDENEDGYSE